ncbi:MAG: RluA family pseudouridine synthase [Firmicutes bacterium]|nr:RluA family pseudouridine synthase [Bacillota bacterium]
MPQRILTANREDAGARLDLFLTRTGLWPSRSFVQKIIADGGATIDRKVLKASYRLEEGDRITVSWEEPKPLAAEPEAIPLDILYEDADLIVVNKPRGMVVHPAAGNYRGTLVNALLDHCRDLSGIGGVIRPGIVHRLDKDTSGILVAAKNDYAHLHLAAQLKARTMKRVYQALVHGNPPESGRVEAPIGRDPVARKKMAVVANGKPAATNYRVVEYFPKFALLEARLESGRTHQIRVHLSHLGYPVVGDPLYGRKREIVPISGQALHAGTLGFIHPRSSEYLEFSKPVPDEMQNAIAWCRRYG